MVVPVGHTPIPYVVAGVIVNGDALSVVTDKIVRFSGTVQRYDALAGTAAKFTKREIDAANVINAQIGRGYTSPHPSAATTPADWAMERLAVANHLWAKQLPVSLVDADPTVVGGSYDALSEYFYEFFDNRWQSDALGDQLRHANGTRLSYVGGTQINKLLYLVLPALVPIFDKELRTKTYAAALRGNKARVLAARGGVNVGNHNDNFSWEPYRLDLVANESAGVFTAIREGLVALSDVGSAVSEVGGSLIPCGYIFAGMVDIYGWAAANLTDNRLMDFLAW